MPSKTGVRRRGDLTRCRAGSSQIRPLALALVFLAALTGCTTGALGDSTPPPTVPAESGADAGNGRPEVNYDGLMVRRRAVLAVLPDAGADLTELRQELDAAATRHGTTLMEIPPDVLDGALLERAVPDLTTVLPPGKTEQEAAQLLDSQLAREPAFPGKEYFEVAAVLVHDLRFIVESQNPAELAEVIDLEGILADSLGNYESVPVGGQLQISYTGPLLSDDLVHSVQRGVARAANTSESEVRVSARSSTGAGVDMAKEPAPPPVVEENSGDHEHPAHLTALGEPGSFTGFWIIGAELAALWLAALVVLVLFRIRRRGATGQSSVDKAG
jgi:hypothetical protein